MTLPPRPAGAGAVSWARGESGADMPSHGPARRAGAMETAGVTDTRLLSPTPAVNSPSWQRATSVTVCALKIFEKDVQRTANQYMHVLLVDLQGCAPRRAMEELCQGGTGGMGFRYEAVACMCTASASPFKVEVGPQ